MILNYYHAMSQPKLLFILLCYPLLLTADFLYAVGRQSAQIINHRSTKIVIKLPPATNVPVNCLTEATLP